MDYIIIDKLMQHQKMTDDECFELTLEVSNLMNASNEENKKRGRDLLIRILDNWANLSDSYRKIFFELVSVAGFYPYVPKLGLQIEDFDEEIRIAFHQSENLDGKLFHAEQKKIDNLIKQHVNVIVSAPTSFGKSMLIEEIVASNEYKNIVIIQPTLALLDETRRKLKKYLIDYFLEFYKKDVHWMTREAYKRLVESERELKKLRNRLEEEGIRLDE